MGRSRSTHGVLRMGTWGGAPNRSKQGNLRRGACGGLEEEVNKSTQGDLWRGPGEGLVNSHMGSWGGVGQHMGSLEGGPWEEQVNTWRHMDMVHGRGTLGPGEELVNKSCGPGEGDLGSWG